MNKCSLKTKLKITSPARYRILVQGGLDRRWGSRLGGLEITTTSPTEDFVVTQLCGELIDQAALFGVLNCLYDLRLPLISVELLNDEDVSPLSGEIRSAGNDN
jgi:hypothetical protein